MEVEGVDACGLAADTNAAAQPERRVAGVARLYGANGLQRFQRAHVLVVGIGGVGSWVVEGLARSGIGRLTLVDMDHIAESNINRQIHALDATLGMAKVEAMRQRIETFQPNIQVDAVDDFVTPENWVELVQSLGQVDAVVDACDQFSAKLKMMQWARQPTVRKSTAFITVGAAGGKVAAEKVAVADLRDTTHDPLLSKARYQLRRELGIRAGKLLHVPCVYSAEPVKASQTQTASSAQASGGLNCAGYGSSVAVTATFGMVAAGWVLQRLSS